MKAKKERHNTLLVDFIRRHYRRLSWNLPMQVLTNGFRLQEREAVRITRKFERYCLAWWLGRILYYTVDKRRPCIRKLRYLGCYCDPEEKEPECFFKIGQIYTSSTFNSATYSIEGYDDLIGCAYFEIVEGEKKRKLHQVLWNYILGQVHRLGNKRKLLEHHRLMYSMSKSTG